MMRFIKLRRQLQVFIPQLGENLPLRGNIRGEIGLHDVAP